MYDFLLSEEQLHLREEVRDFVAWTPRDMIVKMDRDEIRFPEEFLREAGRRNLLGCRHPVDLGGRGLDWVASSMVMEEIGTLGYSFACAFGVGADLVCDAIVIHGTKTQKERYVRPLLRGELFAAEALTEPRGGSDFFGTTSTAVLRGDRYVLNGQKRFIVGAEAADFFLVYARTNPDVPSSEIDWAQLLGRCVGAQSWPVFRDEMHGSGVLLSDYNAVLTATDIEVDELLELGTIEQLRAMLTEQVREDHFSYGSGEYDFWNGTFDETLAALAFRLGMPYDTPRRVLPCPTCGDKARIQTVVFGMPAGPPTPEEEDKYYFAGCVIDGSMGDWFCPKCESFYSVPWVDPFEWAVPETGPEQNGTLTSSV